MSDNPNAPFHTPSALWEKLKPLAHQMRHEPTPTENSLWERLRNRRIAGAKFRRQYTIERFIVDFVCLEHHLIIEVDGDIHDLQQDYDAARQAFLESQGFRMLRFKNRDVLQSLDADVTVIGETLVSPAEDLPHP